MSSSPTSSATKYTVRGLDYSTVDLIKALAFRYRVTQGDVVKEAVWQLWRESEHRRLKDNQDYEWIRADWPPLSGASEARQRPRRPSVAAANVGRDVAK